MTLRLFKQAGRSGLVLWLRTGQVDPDRYPATAALIEQELLYPAHLHLCPGCLTCFQLSMYRGIVPRTERSGGATRVPVSALGVMVGTSTGTI